MSDGIFEVSACASCGGIHLVGYDCTSDAEELEEPEPAGHAERHSDRIGLRDELEDIPPPPHG